MKTILSLMLLAVAFGTLAQQAINGRVIDAESGEPLAFVNIVVNESGKLATSTNIDGLFSIQSDVNIRTLSFSYTWYNDTTITIHPHQDLQRLSVELQPDLSALDEVVILPGENPANRIIREVIAHKDQNNPKKIASYSYQSYNKVIYDMKSTDSLFSATMKKDLQDGHVMVMESVTKKKFKAPNLEEEVVLGNKVSGFSSPSFAPLATDLQPFSFYEDMITIFDISYLNPISSGSLNKYHFQIEDTIIGTNDTTFILSFKPIAKKNFEALEGLLYINTNQYAVQNVIAEPSEKGSIDVRIQQEYVLIDEKQWFPKQLNFELIMNQEKDINVALSVNGKSYISNVVLNHSYKNKDFGIDILWLEDNATQKDSLFWEKHRHHTISNKEKTTYRVMDSIGRKYKFDGLLALSEKLAFGKIPIGWTDLDLKDTFLNNQFEGTRFGFGLNTNERLSSLFSVGGLMGYGSKDNAWKYGGEFNLNVSKKHEIQIKGEYVYTLEEVGISSLSDLITTPLSFRPYLASRMQNKNGSSLTLGFRALRYFKVRLSASQHLITPLFRYAFNSEKEQQQYNRGELRVAFKFAFRERLIQSFNQRISLGTKFPVLLVQYTSSQEGLLSSDYNYRKLETTLLSNFRVKSLGKTAIRIDAGYINQPLPYGLLFTGEGSFVAQRPFIAKDYLQTVEPYEFLSDRFINLHFTHNFGSLLFKTKHFKPHVILHHKSSWGSLRNDSQHQHVTYKTKEKGLYEVGLQLNNLLKINYMNLGYIGLGIGAFYRYGPYTKSNQMDNLALKVAISYTSKK